MKSYYKKAIEFIAENDEPLWTNIEKISEMISVQLTADIFGKTTEEVAIKVRDLRIKWKVLGKE